MYTDLTKGDIQKLKDRGIDVITLGQNRYSI